MATFKTSRLSHGIRFYDSAGQFISEWTYADGIVTGDALHVDGLAVSVLANSVYDIGQWREEIEARNRPPELNTPIQGFNTRTVDENGTVLFRFVIGNLTFRLMYHKATNVFDVDRTAFNLEWEHWLLFYVELKGFLDGYMKAYGM